MSSKVMVIISTAEKAKALTGIMYAVNAQKNKWKGSNVVPNTNRRHQDEQWIETVRELAALPDMVRGFEHLKLERAREYQKRFTELERSITTLRAGGLRPLR